MSEFIHHLIDTMDYQEYDCEDALLELQLLAEQEDWDEYDEMKEQQSQ